MVSENESLRPSECIQASMYSCQKSFVETGLDFLRQFRICNSAEKGDLKKS